MSKLKYYDGTEWQTVNGQVTGDTLPIGSEVDFDGETVPVGWQEIDNPDAYSTSEVKTNKVWIDGKPIYRKVFAGSFSTVNNWTTISNSIITNKQTTTKLCGVFSDYLPIPVYVNSDYYIATQYNASEGIQIYSKGYTGYYSIIIEYTKTTD